MVHIRRVVIIARMVLVAAVLLPLHSIIAAEPLSWNVGDLFVAVGGGSYRVYDQQGRVKQVLGDQVGGYTTDCGFDPTLNKLYTTNFTHTKVVVYDDDLSLASQNSDWGVTTPDKLYTGAYARTRAAASDDDWSHAVKSPDWGVTTPDKLYTNTYNRHTTVAADVDHVPPADLLPLAVQSINSAVTSPGGHSTSTES